jgi:hypothetical protein
VKFDKVAVRRIEGMIRSGSRFEAEVGMTGKGEVGMKRHVYLTALVVALLGLGAVHGQGPAYPPGGNGGAHSPPGAGAKDKDKDKAAYDALNPPENTPPLTGAANGQPPGDGPPIYGPGISEWIAYPRPCGCCGPVGKHGPIGAELYFRTGISFATGGGLVGDNATPGLWIQGGLRTLFFNRAQDAAWTVDLGLSTSWHDIQGAPTAIIRDFTRIVDSTMQIIPEQPVTPSSVNYTLVSLGIGRECYLWGAPDCGGEPRCRVGWDGGGHYGSSKMVLYEIQHRTDTVGGFFLAMHGDIEVPTGCCILYAGARLEYGVLWSDILTSRNDTNVQLINLLVNFGLRY